MKDPPWNVMGLKFGSRVFRRKSFKSKHWMMRTGYLRPIWTVSCWILGGNCFRTYCTWHHTCPSFPKPGAGGKNQLKAGGV